MARYGKSGLLNDDVMRALIEHSAGLETIPRQHLSAYQQATEDSLLTRKSFGYKYATREMRVLI
jgi:hypothetical protein